MPMPMPMPIVGEAGGEKEWMPNDYTDAVGADVERIWWKKRNQLAFKLSAGLHNYHPCHQQESTAINYILFFNSVSETNPTDNE